MSFIQGDTTNTDTPQGDVMDANTTWICPDAFSGEPYDIEDTFELYLLVGGGEGTETLETESRGKKLQIPTQLTQETTNK